MTTRRAPGKPSLGILLDQVRDGMDQLCAEESGGVRSAAHYDAMEQTAQSLAQDLVYAFRAHRPR